MYTVPLLLWIMGPQRLKHFLASCHGMRWAALCSAGPSQSHAAIVHPPGPGSGQVSQVLCRPYMYLFHHYKLMHSPEMMMTRSCCEWCESTLYMSPFQAGEGVGISFLLGCISLSHKVTCTCS